MEVMRAEGASFIKRNTSLPPNCAWDDLDNNT